MDVDARIILREPALSNEYSWTRNCMYASSCPLAVQSKHSIMVYSTTHLYI